jgi:hypothetical protein
MIINQQNKTPKIVHISARLKFHGSFSPVFLYELTEGSLESLKLGIKVYHFISLEPYFFCFGILFCRFYDFLKILD